MGLQSRFRHIHSSLTVVLLVSIHGMASAQTADRLHELIVAPGVSGYEAPVRERIEMLLPAGARVRADNLGNIVLRTGSGSPHTLIVAPLDEPGLVVSAITDEGYLRLHRHTAAGPALALQYVVGQPVIVHAAAGTAVEGVSVTPSAHLRAMRDRADEARLKTIDDLWIDIGAASRAEAEARGVRLLDSVTLRERATRLAGSRVSGVHASGRAAALALAEVVRRSSGRGAAGSVTLAWVVQTQYGQRGVQRLLETLPPDRLIVLRSAPAGRDPRGASGTLGGGPVVSEQGIALPERWRALPQQTLHVPALFAETPVETVDARDVDALAEQVASAIGLTLAAPANDNPLSPPAPLPAGEDNPRASLLRTLIETQGVSGDESRVRDQVLARLPSWARPSVDARGNVIVRVGAGGTPLVFIAHLDEVGFEITSLEPDGTARLAVLGGMYLSVYEAHPVVVQTPRGPVDAVLAPRRDYAAATPHSPGRKRCRCTSAPTRRTPPPHSGSRRVSASPCASRWRSWARIVPRAARWTIASARQRCCSRCSGSTPRGSATTSPSSGPPKKRPA